METSAPRVVQAKQKYHLSCDINLNVRVKIESIEGKRPKLSVSKILDDDVQYSGLYAGETRELYVTSQVFDDGEPLCLPKRTTHFTFTSQCKWDVTVGLDVKYRDLSQDAVVAFTVWDVYGPGKITPVGGSTCRLFSESGNLKKGRQKLVLWPGAVADPARTPGRIAHENHIDRLERVIKRYDRGEVERVGWLDKCTFQKIYKINEVQEERDAMFLYIELQPFPNPVTFREARLYEQHVPFPRPTADIVLVHDAEVGRENPVEKKFHKLARHQRRGAAAAHAKPNAAQRRALQSILAYPPTRALTGDERELVFQFRYSLMREGAALIKFLKCVDWSDEEESAHAVTLMHGWTAPEVEDSLELLRKEFTHPLVREYAVRQLRQADHELFLTFLLQLVQALRYEAELESDLFHFLMARATSDVLIGNYFHWYLKVEMTGESDDAAMYAAISERFLAKLKASAHGRELHVQLERQERLVGQLNEAMGSLKGARPKKIAQLKQALSPEHGGHLGHLTALHPPLRLPVMPELRLSAALPDEAYIFKSALNPIKLGFRVAAADVTAAATATRPPVRKTKTPAAALAAAAAAPHGSPAVARVIFKVGDDLRQDQLIVQMIGLMDMLLKKENLDLKLTRYRVLATSCDDGMVEFVYNSTALGTVLQENKGDIRRFFARHHPDPQGPYGITASVLDTFVKSCAGYCVITYLLGVGDRHLDNLMLMPTGNLFHVDFGYIFGRDPKALPPPFKCTREMVEAMGGADSPHYSAFKSYCCEAYNILRKRANLFLTLFLLMSDANIPDMANEPEKSILKLQEKFRLDLSDEDAVQFFQDLINESISALFPQITETIHRWAQYWRS